MSCELIEQDCEPVGGNIGWNGSAPDCGVGDYYITDEGWCDGCKVTDCTDEQRTQACI